MDEYPIAGLCRSATLCAMTNPSTKRALIIAGAAAAAVALVLVGALAAVALMRPDTPTTPAAATSPAAPSPARDGFGEAACKALEKHNEKYVAATYLSELGNIATEGMQATDEDVREQSEALWDVVKRYGKDSNIDVFDLDRQKLNLIRACDDANYAF